MNKLAVVINGAGGVGKDTLCDLAAKHFRTVKVSTIDPIKKIAAENGWRGEKTPEARKFLASLKQVFAEYNDLPTEYAVGEYKKFLSDESENGKELFFIHIREGEQIKHFIERAKASQTDADSGCGKIVTLLVRSKRAEESYGNPSDDEVENFNYDYIFINDLPLSEAESEFVKLIKEIMKQG